jgi:hypothetical protein
LRIITFVTSEKVETFSRLRIDSLAPIRAFSTMIDRRSWRNLQLWNGLEAFYNDDSPPDSPTPRARGGCGRCDRRFEPTKRERPPEHGDPAFIIPELLENPPCRLTSVLLLAHKSLWLVIGLLILPNPSCPCSKPPLDVQDNLSPRSVQTFVCEPARSRSVGFCGPGDSGSSALTSCIGRS